MRHILLVLIGLCLSGLSISAQKAKLVKVHASYTYYMEGGVTVEQARYEAVRRAQSAAMRDAFGTLVIDTEIVRDEAVNGNARSQYRNYGLTEMRGCWIKDERAPDITGGYDEKRELWWVRAEVWGLAREVRDNNVDLDVKFLRNGRDDNAATLQFREGDRLRISFKSPIQGHLAIYCVDTSGGLAYRALPTNCDEGHRPLEVQANMRYLYLDEDECDAYFSCGGPDVEYDRMYVLFSPHAFNLPNDEAGGRLTADEREGLRLFPDYNWVDNIQISRLDKWMASLRMHDEDCIFRIFDISVSKNE